MLVNPLRHGLDTGIMFEVDQNLLVQKVWVVGWNISYVIGGMSNKSFKIYQTPTECSVHLVMCSCKLICKSIFSLNIFIRTGRDYQMQNDFHSLV